MKSLFPLLQAIAADKSCLSTSEISDELLEFSINAGVAGLLQHYSKKNIKLESSLISAALTAKLITHVQLHALNEIVKTANNEITEIVLLKGISICQMYYPVPQLRIMGDIDLLVSDKNVEKLEHVLLNIGYKQTSQCADEYYSTHHHSMPFYNKKNNVWVEVHRHLFSGSNPVLDDPLFEINNIFKNTISINNENYSEIAKQLCPEIQLVYTCSHWANELKINKSCIQIVDMIYLIKNNGKDIDWNRLFNWVNNTASASYLYLILSYFDKNNLISLPENYSRSFKLKHTNMGFINRLILHKIICIYMLGQKSPDRVFTETNLAIIWCTLLRPSSSIANFMLLPINILFPPKAENRYRISLLIYRIKNMFMSQ